MAGAKGIYSQLQKRTFSLLELPLTIFYIILFSLSVIILAQSFSFVTIAVALIILGGTLHALEWSIAISDAVSKEHKYGTFELLSLTPSGAFGVSWHIALALLYRRGAFLQRLDLYKQIVFSIRVLILFLIIGVVSQGRTLFWAEVAIVVATPIAFAAAIYVDFIQSIVIGVLVGMIVPTFSREQFDAQLWGVFGFLGAQFGSYFVTYLVGFVVLPVVGQALGLESITFELFLLVPRIAIFFLVREALIALLWRWLALQFNEETAIIKA